MKLLELISHLQVAYTKMGDIDVACWSNNNEQITRISSVTVDRDETHIEILLCGDTI